MNADPLSSQLRKFAEKLAQKGIRLVIGGGYGLLLKASHVQQIGARTRLDQIPVTRSTTDIDVFLTTEVIIDKNNMAVIRQALDELDYSPVPGAKYYQFSREIVIGGAPRNLKFDFLAAPVLGEQANKVRADIRRIRPRGVTGSPMHAHTTPEAFTVEEHLLAVNIGEADQRVDVFLPHPFSYVLLKLFALRDQIDNEKKEFGRHHAFDIYSTWAMMTEEEFEQAERLRATYEYVGVMLEAVEIAQSLFADATAMGMIRLKEHAHVQNVDLLESTDFAADISTLFRKSRAPAS